MRLLPLERPWCSHSAGTVGSRLLLVWDEVGVYVQVSPGAGEEQQDVFA